MTVSTTSSWTTYMKQCSTPPRVITPSRSQYDQLAANMRLALPNAAFIGFTGTPLIAGQEERTREVFGDYVSIYNFAQSVADGATVPLFYEARKPELQLAKEDLRDELDALLEDAALDDEQEKRLGREFGRQYHLITRTSRLDEVAADLVRHFLGARLSRQGDVRRHRQGHSGEHVRPSEAALAGAHCRRGGPPHGCGTRGAKRD